MYSKGSRIQQLVQDSLRGADAETFVPPSLFLMICYIFVLLLVVIFVNDCHLCLSHLCLSHLVLRQLALAVISVCINTSFPKS